MQRPSSKVKDLETTNQAPETTKFKMISIRGRKQVSLHFFDCVATVANFDQRTSTLEGALDSCSILTLFFFSIEGINVLN